MAHTIVNPNRAADYFDTAGSAISTQPDILGGSVGGVSSNTGYFSNTLAFGVDIC